jgi:hypothetical protein
MPGNVQTLVQNFRADPIATKRKNTPFSVRSARVFQPALYG